MKDCTILAGESALSHAGLITLGTGGHKQVWTLTQATPVTEGVDVAYYWSPFADKSFLLQGKVDTNFFLPTQERALIEYMMFSDYFSEEFLLEGIQTYEDVRDGDISKLREVAEQMYLREDIFEYWIKEAHDYGFI